MTATDTQTDFRKVVRIGSVPIGTGRQYDTFCEINYKDGGLSISGVIGPMPNGNAQGSCGQIRGNFKHRNPDHDDARTYQPVDGDEITYAPGWDKERFLDFLDAWAKWHLNDMRAGCEHQYAAGWDRRPIDPDRPTTDYGRFFPWQRKDSWNLLAWITPDEHPDGLLTAPCPECGYRYGSAWLSEDVPADVLDMLRNLPHTDKTPAWI